MAGPKYVGVDGCRYGWFSVALDDTEYELTVCRTFRQLLNYYRMARLVLVDIPIGLPVQGAGRDCDEQARERIGNLRQAVFQTPTREAIEQVGALPECCLAATHLLSGWVAGDDALGMSPYFRESLAGLGMRYVLDAPSSTRVWPLELAWTSAGSQESERPRKPRLRDGQRRTMKQRSDELPDKAWREITVAQGSQGSRSYMFCAQRVRVALKGNPGQEARAVYRRNLDGSEPRYYLSNAAEDTPLETLACVGGSRWPIESEFETEKGTWAWTNTRPGVGPAGITT